MKVVVVCVATAALCCGVACHKKSPSKEITVSTSANEQRFETPDQYRQLGRALAIHTLAMEFDKAEVEQVIQGFREGLKAKPTPLPESVVASAEEAIVRRAKELEGRRAAASQSYVSELAKAKGVQLAKPDQPMVLSRKMGSGAVIDGQKKLLLTMKYQGARKGAEALALEDTRTALISEVGPCLGAVLPGEHIGSQLEVVCTPGSFVPVNGMPPMVYPGESTVLLVSVSQD